MTTSAIASGVDGCGVAIFNRSFASVPVARSTGAAFIPDPPMSMPNAVIVIAPAECHRRALSRARRAELPADRRSAPRPGVRDERRAPRRSCRRARSPGGNPWRRRAPSQQRPRGHRRGPVPTPDEDHRRDRLGLGVVVLAGVLEDLLHRAGRPGEEHDAAVAPVEQRRLAHRVLEVLGDRRRRRRSAARGRRTTSGPRCRRRRRATGRGPSIAAIAQRPIDGLNDGTAATIASASSRAAPACRDSVGAEVRGLHRPRTASGGDHEPRRRQRCPSRAASRVRRLAPGDAWPPITPTTGEPGAARSIVEGGVDRRVVQRPDDHVGGLAGEPLRPGVDPRRPASPGSRGRAARRTARRRSTARIR